MNNIRRIYTLLAWSSVASLLLAAILPSATICEPLPQTTCPMDSLEYQILSDFIQVEHSGSPYVIVSRPYDVALGIDRLMTPYGETMVKREIVVSFVARNSTRCSFERRFRFKADYSLIDSDSLRVLFRGSPLDGWDAFDSRYPHAHGYMQVSRPGIDSAQTEALVSYSIVWSPFTGWGGLLLLKKIEGKWIREKTIEELVN